MCKNIPAEENCLEFDGCNVFPNLDELLDEHDQVGVGFNEFASFLSLGESQVVVGIMGGELQENCGRILGEFPGKFGENSGSRLGGVGVGWGRGGGWGLREVILSLGHSGGHLRGVGVGWGTGGLTSGFRCGETVLLPQRGQRGKELSCCGAELSSKMITVLFCTTLLSDDFSLLSDDFLPVHPIINTFLRFRR